ncbi:hypothetical protein [Streptomyces vietnamensis]|uniref:Uncharacterized protein n=1 Tax=Streptomyces vietnamensis TaxID=362257 RepID=A0A0B5IFS8_9ACTN|nr:hypothetical protein [Streptomyces vietnamensis]AJF68568.1 hypothetical protein SVTN_33730 [Streptomyces vietnamensis]
MPEFYSSIGEAIGAAMQHNIRLAHRSVAPSSDKSLLVRHLPSASADPYSVPGMIARLTEDATPNEVAGIIEEVNGALVGALPQLTELVAAAADWTRVRLAFDDPHHNPVFETWTRLAAAHVMLQDVQELLAAAEDGIAPCPAERTDPRYHERVNVLRTRELLDDVLGTGPVAAEPPARDPNADRRRAARASTPQTGPRQPSSPGTEEVPACTPPLRFPEGPSMANLADTYGTDVEIFPWADGLVWADCRTGLPESAHRVLRSCGFAAPGDPGDPASYSLASHIVGPDRQLASSSAASMLADLGYRVAIDPSLAVGYTGETVGPEARRLAAAHQVSPVAAETNTGTSAPPPATPPPSAARPVPRSR